MTGQVLRPLSQHFLWASYQMDICDKTKGFRKLSNHLTSHEIEASHDSHYMYSYRLYNAIQSQKKLQNNAIPKL